MGTVVAYLSVSKDKGIDIEFLEAFHPESAHCKKAIFIDKTLEQSAKLMVEINESKSIQTLKPLKLSI